MSCIVSISLILGGFMIILGLKVLDEVLWLCNMEVASSWWDNIFSCFINNCEKTTTMSSCEGELLEWIQAHFDSIVFLWRYLMFIDFVVARINLVVGFGRVNLRPIYNYKIVTTNILKLL